MPKKKEKLNMSKTFNKLSNKEKQAVLEIANQMETKKEFVKEYSKTVKQVRTETIRNFLIKNGATEEDAKQIKLKQKKIIRVNDISGPLVKKVIVTFDNQHDVVVMDPPYTYGKDPRNFGVISYAPDGTQLIAALDQKAVDINKELKRVGKLPKSDLRNKTQKS